VLSAIVCRIPATGPIVRVFETKKETGAGHGKPYTSDTCQGGHRRRAYATGATPKKEEASVIYRLYRIRQGNRLGNAINPCLRWANACIAPRPQLHFSYPIFGRYDGLRNVTKPHFSRARTRMSASDATGVLILRRKLNKTEHFSGLSERSSPRKCGGCSISRHAVEHRVPIDLPSFEYRAVGASLVLKTNGANVPGTIGH